MYTRVSLIVSVTVAAGICLAGILFWFGLRNGPHRADDIWLEVAKTGLQLGVITIIGGGIATLLKKLEAARDERRRLNEYRFEFLRSVVASYNRIKSVRRILRAHGFRSPTGGHLTHEQVSVFNTQFQHLNDDQLTLEALYRDVKAQPTVFANSTCIQGALGTVEKYVHGVIQNWEDHGAEVVPTAEVKVLNSMSELQAFLGKPKLGFDSGSAGPLETLAKEIGSQLLKTTPKLSFLG